MIEVRDGGAERRRLWQAELPSRIEARWAPIGAGGNVANRMRGVARADLVELAVLPADGVEVGYVALTHYRGEVFGIFDNAVVFFDVWVDPQHRGQGYGRAARDYGERWGREHGATTAAAALWADDPGVQALFANYPLRNQRLSKPLGPPIPLPASDWTYRAMGAGGEYDTWRRQNVIGYAADITDSGSATAEQAAAEAEREYEALLPNGLDTPEHSFWIIEAEGQPVADIWLKHQMAPDLSFVYGVEVRPGARGRGYGRAAMLVGEDRSRAAGDSFIGLNVFGHNETAIGLYTSLGYQFVDSTRSTSLD
jgi:GNAT superfamily N-acetyltransferase